MSRFAHLAARFYDEPLAMTLERAEAWERVIRSRMEGDRGQDELHSRTLATERLEALANANDARPVREGYALTESGIAIIPIHGGLVQRGGWMESESGLTGYNSLARTLRAADRNPDVRGIVFDVDSPGGEVAGMFEMADMIAGTEKPTRAIANDVAASAGYLLASAAGKLYATKTSTVGSIGILAMHVDRSKQHDKAGVKYTPIVAGSRKTEGSSLAPLSGDARSAIQGRVDATQSIFVETIGANRGIDADDVRATEGAVMQANEAKDAGLIDGVSTLGQVIQDFAAELESSSRTEQRPRAAASAESSIGEDAMSNEKPNAAPAPVAGITPEQLTAAVAAALPAERAAVQARIAAILDHPESEGRGKLARHLAFKSNATVEEAAATLAEAARDAPAAPGKPADPLAAAMEKTPNPDISARGDGLEADSPEAAAAAIIAFLPRKRAK